ncbi:MAG: glycosyltransferase family 87 protein [Planctomycetaceae bacterium]
MRLSPALKERLKRRTLPLLLVGVVAWGFLDVFQRAKLDPDRIDKHRTDFTVYTEAGAAFFDGRDPYEVTNARGWHYLYPPLFALLVAPLHGLPPEWQGLVWYAASVLLALLCLVEVLRIARLLEPPAPGENPERRALGDALALAALLAVAFPTFNTLQRGQVGIAVGYPLLLGFRLLLAARGPRALFLGGIVLALPVAIKATPALPVCALLLQRLAAWARPRRTAGSGGRFLAPASGALCGALLFFLLLPALFVGWKANLGHLDTWVERVAGNRDLGPDENFNVRGLRNQSMENGAYRFGNWVAHRFARGPDDTIADDFSRAREKLPMDTAAFKVSATIARILLALLMVLVALRHAHGGERIYQAAVFGLSCTITLPLSPISWAHHYVFLLPGVVFVPLALVHAGRPVAARRLAVAATALPVLHYSLLMQAGRVGLLGLGMAAWTVAAAAALLRTPRA